MLRRMDGMPAGTHGFEAIGDVDDDDWDKTVEPALGDEIAGGGKVRLLYLIGPRQFWGGSGVWAPSGLRLVEGSHVNEELLIVHNLDITGARQAEREDFDYAIDFSEVYRPLEGSRAFTRSLE